MSTLRKYAVPALLISMVLLAAWVAATVWFKTEESAELSCLGSVHTLAVQRLTEQSRLPAKETRELSREEITELFADRDALDCFRRGYLLDDLHISIGDVNEHFKSPVRVWSNGWDRKLGTHDDLIVPFQEMRWYRDLNNR